MRTGPESTAGAVVTHRAAPLALLVALVVAACGGSASPSVSPSASLEPTPASSPNPSATPAPTATAIRGMFAVGDRELYIECQGVGSPTVIFEAGLGQPSLYFDGVVGDLAPTTRTCRYDRGGIGQSRGLTGAPDLTVRDRADELHALLESARVDGPYVLAGFSYGGILIRAFADRYPEAVAGLVFIDASHEEQFDPAGWWYEAAKWEDGVHTVDRAASRAQMLEAGDLGARPLVVLTNGLMQGESERQWSPLQDAIAGLSTDSLHMVATEAGHDITKDRPALVVAAVEAVVAAIRAESPLPACGPTFEAVGAECLESTLVALIERWDAERAAIVPAAGDLPDGTYTFELDGDTMTCVFDGGRLDVTIRPPSGAEESFTARYAASGETLSIVWPFDRRFPRTAGINILTWSVDGDGALRLIQTDDAPEEPWFSVPWVLSGG